MRIAWCSAVSILCLAGGEPLAHHSIARVYDDASRSTLRGVVTEFRFINPHPLLFVEVVDESGATEAWRLEMDNRFELERIGMTEETFAAGDRIVAHGSLGRTQPRALYLRRLDRPADGLRYEQIGFRPSLTVDSSRR